MKLVVISQNLLEVNGLKWVIESHMNGVEVSSYEKEGNADCLIIDMDLWTPDLETMLSHSDIPWIGLSSDRTFLTAYRALKGKAADLLFRPFDPMSFIKQLQQIRYRLRNSPAESEYIKSGMLRYEDFFSEDTLTPNITLAAFVMSDKEAYPVLYQALKEYPFHERTEIFAFSDFVLIAYLSGDEQACMEESRMFYAAWKRQGMESLSIFVNADRRETVKQYYQETREPTSLIFYEGYDIAVMEKKQLEWQSLDPFLSPVEQRTWIEMLEKKDTVAIQSWMENEFLAYSRPYPDPEMIRVRLTSVLAQARRYMKSVQLKSESWEQRYHEVFEVIVKGPVVYGIVQAASNFIVQLVQEATARQGNGGGSDIEKARELMEANYWNPDWNLAACAEQLMLNKSTLSRRFQQKKGQKFNRALAEIRLREAKRLMKETELPLEEVARLTGFSNASYFSAVYKKYEKLSPSDFRKGNEPVSD